MSKSLVLSNESIKYQDLINEIEGVEKSKNNQT